MENDNECIISINEEPIDDWYCDREIMMLSWREE